MLHILKNSKQLTQIRRQASVIARNFSGSWQGTGGTLVVKRPMDMPGHLPLHDTHHHHEEHHGKEHDDHSDDDHHDHHHEKEYDWRDDPEYNKDLYYDIRDRGWDPTKYKFPYEGRDVWNLPFPPTNVNLDDPTINFRPENTKYLVHAADGMRASYWDPDNDMAHEADYESEDLDFQPEDFKTQHFKKKGFIWPWFIAALTWHIYFWLEFLYQHYPDEDNWRVPRPPPLDFPDADDTDDTDSFQMENTEEGRYWRETGIITELWYDIKDGKKVIKRFGGANQPMPMI